MTPISLTTHIGASAVVPAFAFLPLRFVPEPTTALLLGGGVATLLWIARRRR